MTAEHWFRWHHGTVTDPKWRIVAKRASHTMSRNVTVGHTLSVWAAMLENASQASPRGQLMNWSDEDIGAALDIDESEVAAIREAMEGKVLNDGELIAWNRRQIKRLDETSADRKAIQRARNKSQPENVTMRDIDECHTQSHNVTVETETETEKKEQKKEREKTTPKTNAVEIGTWLASLGDGDVLPTDDPIFEYAKKSQIPEDFLELCLDRFIGDMTDRHIRKTGWRQHFRNAVKGNWYRLWWLKDDGTYALTTAGEQARRVAE